MEKPTEVEFPESPRRVLKVAVSSEGTISLDGAVVSLSALRNELDAVRGTNAVVWYYRENPQEDPSQEASLVMEAVIENRLPISLSTKPDFSTVTTDGVVIRER